MALSFPLAVVLLVWVAGTIVLGAMLAARGWVGRPIFRGPACARCGQGIAARPGATGVACAECGADLGREHGVRYFARERSPRAILLGLTILASSLLVPMGARLAATASFGARSSGPIGRGTTTEQLADSIAHADADSASAVVEAVRRVVDGELSDAELLQLVEAIRGKPATAPAANRGELDLLLAARGRDLIDDEALRAFGRRETRRPPALFSPVFRSPRDIEILPAPATSLRQSKLSMVLVALRLDQKEIPLTDTAGQPLSTLGPFGLASATLSGEPGEHILHATYEETYTLVPDLMRSLPPRTLTGRYTEPTTVRILTKDDPTWITLHSPPDRRAEVEAACRCSGVALDCPAGGGTCVLRAAFDVAKVEGVSVAFEVVVQLEGKEYVVGKMVIISASSTTSTLGPWQTPVEIPRPKGSPPTKVNVLFRPAPALAEPFPGSTSVWGEVIERRDLPLESTPQPGGTR